MYLLIITKPECTAVAEDLPKLVRAAELVAGGPLQWQPFDNAVNEDNVRAFYGNEVYTIKEVAVL